MNFGVVFAFILSLPLARMEVSFRHGQRAVLPICRLGAGGEPPASPARRCGGRSPGAAGERRGRGARGRGPGPAPRQEQRRGPDRANGGQRPPPTARRAAPAGERTPMERALPSGRARRGGSPGNTPTPVSAPGCRDREDQAEASSWLMWEQGCFWRAPGNPQLPARPRPGLSPRSERWLPRASHPTR